MVQQDFTTNLVLIQRYTQFYIPSLQDSGNYVQEETERVYKPQRTDGTKGTVLSKHSRTGTHMDSETVAECTGPAQV